MGKLYQRPPLDFVAYIASVFQRSYTLILELLDARGMKADRKQPSWEPAFTIVSRIVMKIFMNRFDRYSVGAGGAIWRARAVGWLEDLLSCRKISCDWVPGSGNLWWKLWKRNLPSILQGQEWSLWPLVLLTRCRKNLYGRMDGIQLW